MRATAAFLHTRVFRRSVERLGSVACCGKLYTNPSDTRLNRRNLCDERSARYPRPMV